MAITKEQAQAFYEKAKAQGYDDADIKEAIRAKTGTESAPPPTDPNLREQEQIREAPGSMGFIRPFEEGVRSVRQLLSKGEEHAKLEAVQKQFKDNWEAVDPPGSGVSMGDLGRTTGTMAMMAAPGAAISKGASLATAVPPLLRAMGAGATAGGLQGGVLTPTVPGESRGANAALGAGFGAAVPAGGSLLRSIFGNRSLSREAAAAAMKRLGVNVPEGSKYDSMFADAIRKMAGPGEDSVGPQITNALEQKLGKAGSLSDNMALEAHKKDVGGQIGNLFDGTEATPDRDFVQRLLAAGQKFHQGMPPKDTDPTLQNLDHLLGLASTGRPISGAAYQAKRTDIGPATVTGSSSEKIANSAMVRALDALFKPTLVGTGKESMDDALRSQYRLMSILRSGRGIPAEGFTPQMLKTKIEQAAGKGRVDPEVRQLLDAAARIAPGARIGSEQISGGVQNGLERTFEHMMEGQALAPLTLLLRAGATPLNKLGKTGIPQRFLNSPLVRKTTGSVARAAGIPMLLRSTGEE